MFEDNQYWTYRDGKMVEVPPIDTLCLMLKEKFLRQVEDNKRLSETNEKLKNGIWEKEEVAKYKSEYERMKGDYFRGFPISEEENKKIREWQDNHKCPYRNMKIGGRCHYEFVPTEIGVAGTVICSCGQKFTFQELG